MSFIKRILVKIYHTGIVEYLLVELTRKVAVILAPIEDKINVIDIRTLDINERQQKIWEQQLDLLKNIERIQLNICAEGENRSKNQLALFGESNNKHDEQLLLLRRISINQGFSAYEPSFQKMRGRFLKVIHDTFDGFYPAIHNKVEMLFLEVFIGHMVPGGLWKLDIDLASFENSKATGQIRQQSLNDEVHGQQNLKILIVAGCFPSIMHGGGGRLFDIIFELSKCHSIDLYTHYNEIHDKTSLNLLYEKIDNIKLVDFPDINEHSIGAWLRSINRDMDYYDIVQLEYPQTIRLIKPMSQFGKKVGFTFMESLSKSFTEKLNATIMGEDVENISNIARSFWRYIVDEKFAMDNADYRITVTPEDAEFLALLSNSPAFIVPTCISSFAIINEANEYANVVQEDKAVAFVGFFDHWPNMEAMEWYLRDIHPVVKKELPGYKLYIVGCGNVLNLHKLTEGDDSVIITGLVESVVPFILKSKICISPLISGAGIRGKLNQYAVLGRPSVTTSIGNKGLVYKNEDSVLIADEPENFAKAMVRLMTNDKLYLSMQVRAKNVAINNYTWKSHIHKLEAIYKGV